MAKTPNLGWFSEDHPSLANLPTQGESAARLQPPTPSPQKGYCIHTSYLI